MIDPSLDQQAALGTILIVEDEFLIRMMLAESLSDSGFSVLEAGNADEGLAVLQGPAAIGVMITDVSLPGSMDGVELAGRARQLFADLPVIFVTGRPDSVDVALLQPRDQIVAKPYLPSEIATAARRILQAR